MRKRNNSYIVFIVMAVWMVLSQTKVNASGLGTFSSGSFFAPSKYTEKEEIKTCSSHSTHNMLTNSAGTHKDAFSNQVRKQYPVKDQGDYSTCWAFSLASAAEINLYKKGITDEFLNLSESHLAYFFFHRVEDQWQRTNGDAVNYVGRGNYLEFGNDSNFAIMALANWVGFADEELGKYSEVAASKQTFQNLSKNNKIALQMNDQVHLNNVEIVDSSNRNLIKRKLNEYGAATTGIYYDKFFYNKKKANYYSEGFSTTNHSVTCIGYNDHYSKNNFNDKPKKDGAWLMLNSWGDSWGNKGYFWVSYYDESLREFNFIDVSLADDYDTIYQYDGSSGTYSKTYHEKAGCANVYTTSSKIESLEAVSFYTLEDDVDIKVRIYIGFKNAENKGTLVHTISQQISSAGYHTLPLKHNILLEPNTVFAVEVEYSGRKTVRIPYDRSYTVMIDGKPAIKFVAKANQGESYAIGNTGKWTPFNYNYRIKAFTSESKEENISPLETTIEFYKGTQKLNTIIRTEKGQMYPLKPHVHKGYTFVGWYSDPQCKNKVSYIVLDGKEKKLYLKESINIGKTTGLKCSKYSNKTVTLTWNKASNAKMYEVYQYKENKKQYERIKVVTGTACKITNLTSNTTYKFRIRAMNGNSKGAYSNSVKTVTTLKKPVLNLKGKAKDKTKTIRVSKNKTAQKFEVYIKQGKGAYKLIHTGKITNGKVKKKTISLTSKKNYTVKVRVFAKHSNKKYFSSYSKTVKVKKTSRLIFTP
ncbi:MAG: lectin like domain-containing protein [bacterium]|nr:lectin like domain-containing protein [bacterium]